MVSTLLVQHTTMLLIDEFVRRGVDVSAISNGHSISFAHHVAFDESSMKQIIQD